MVLTCRNSMAVQTFGSMAGQALELWVCAPNMRYGAPSTIKAYRPSFFTKRGIGPSYTWAGSVAATLTAIRTARTAVFVFIYGTPECTSVSATDCGAGNPACSRLSAGWTRWKAGPQPG